MEHRQICRVSDKQIVRSLLTDAKNEHAGIWEIEAMVLNKHALLLQRAWRLGELDRRKIVFASNRRGNGH
jgi:hypothetical protein